MDDLEAELRAKLDAAGAESKAGGERDVAHPRTASRAEPVPSAGERPTEPAGVPIALGFPDPG